MNISIARQFGRVPVTALACALVAATLPAFASAQGTGTVDAPPTQEALILTDDAYAINAGDALAIVAPGVLANDKHAGVAVPRIVSLVAGPSHGSLALGQDGGFEYQPAKGFTGMDAFRYGVTMDGAYGEANVTLAVVSSTDLGVSIAAAPTADLGAPVTFTLTVVNKATTDANGMELQVRVSGARAGTGTPSFSSSGCALATMPGSGQTWTCRSSRIPAGGTYQTSITVDSNGPSTLNASAQVASAETDSDPADNAAAAVVQVGRVSANPGRVTGRLQWNTGAAQTTAGLTLNNLSPLSLSYETSSVDQTGRDVVPSWFSVSPASGQVDAYSSQSLTVSLSAVGQTPGLKRGLLHIVHDSPFELGDVPVSFTVAFTDVPVQRTDDVYVHALAGAGVTAGCREGSFCPDAPLSRAGATVWMLLAREGRSFEPAPAEGLFQDVRLSRAEAGFIEELVRRGVAEGCDADNFCPDAPLARADAAVMIVKMLSGVRYVPTASTGLPMFRDMRNDPRAAWVEDAVRRGVFSACSAGPRFFCPDQPLTRGDAAVSIVKAFDLPLY